MRTMRVIYAGVGKALLFVFLISCSNTNNYQPVLQSSQVEINSKIEGNEKIENIIEPYREKLDSIMNEVIGYAAHDMTTKGRYESVLGTFVTKLLLKQSESVFNQKVDVAIINHHGGLRASINQGEVTLGEVFSVMPFENEVLLLELSGEELTEMIRFTAVRNSSMMWPVSFQVNGQDIENIRLDSQVIIPSQKYVLAVSDYMANGGSGYQMLKTLKRQETEPVKLRDLIALEIRQQTAKGDTLKASVSNLITIATP